MDAESLAQIERIVTVATDQMRQEMTGIAGGLGREMGLMESRLGDRLEETKRYMDVLAEGLRHDVQLVAEAGQLHSERLADIRREVEMQARETRALLQLSYEQSPHPTRCHNPHRSNRVSNDLSLRPLIANRCRDNAV